MAREGIHNVAVIGYGFSAKIFHIPFILQVSSLKLYGVVQRSPTPENDAAKDFSGIKSWRSAEEMLTDPAVALVIITTFPESHFALTQAALEAGKHVVVEKPWVDSTKEAEELIAVAKKAGRKLTVFQNRRWDSDLLTVKQLIDSGTLGRIFEFESHFDRFRPALPTKTVFQSSQKKDYCAGCIYDLGTHLIDQVVFLFGLPTHITAFLTNQRAEETINGDSLVLILRYANGMLVTLKGAVLSTEQEQLRFWVRGEKGSFKKWHEDVQEAQLLSRSSQPGQPGFGEDPESHYGTLMLAEDGKFVSKRLPTVKPPTYTGYYEQLAEALTGNGELPVEPEVAASVIRIVELARESWKTGRTIEYSPS